MNKSNFPAYLNDAYSPLSGKEERNFNRFWGAFILYTLCYALSPTSHTLILICQGLQFVSLIVMIVASFGFFDFKLSNSFLRFIFTLYYLWLIITVLRGYSHFSDKTYVKNFFSNPYAGILYFAPLLIYFPRNLESYKRLFKVILLLGVFYVLYDIRFIKDLLSSGGANKDSQAIVEVLANLSFACGFILLTIYYHSTKKQLLATGILLLSLFFAVIRARRGLILMYSNILFFSYVLYVIQSKKKVLIIYLSVFVGLLGVIYISGIYKPLENNVYGFLVSRGDEDSRIGVELYFYDDFKTKDWIIGRGMEGEYFCPDIEEDQVTDYRDTIETGFLQTILKGGWISLGLFLLIAVPGIIKGIFFSKNTLSKAAAIWILMSILNSYPTVVTAFVPQYLLVWISIGICYSKNIRNLEEAYVRKYFLESQ